ncbi:RHS repeat-associated core domain-containing protein [Sorangium sp. So ce1099]|uniref:RHS repeat-associated core domain-containing protein n=1 Tax=Sorangium sp. So ce1099 TaxID=3133331 RepID=UPI003F603738
MARTAPIPNIPAIPGMNPGVFVMGGGGTGGGSGAGNGAGTGGAQGAGGANGGKGASGGGKGAGQCGPGSGGGCPNPIHGGAGTAAGDPVDVLTGVVYTVPEVDLLLPGPIPLALRRSYSTLDASEDVGLGFGWRHSLVWEVHQRRRQARVIQPHGPASMVPLPEVAASVELPFGSLLRLETGYTIDARDGLLRSLVRVPGSPDRFVLTRISDVHGNAIRLEYDSAGELVRIFDAVGREVRVRRDQSRRVAAFEVQADPEGHRWVAFRRYAYDGSGNLVEATSAVGSGQVFEYDQDHRLLRRREAGGLSAHFRYDRAGRCFETWCTRERGDDGLDERVPDVLADGTKARGILHARIEFGDNYAEVVTSRGLRRYEGTGFGHAPLAVWGAGAHTKTYGPHGELTQYTNGEQATFTWSYDTNGRLNRFTDPMGGGVHYAYDGRGAVTAVVDALGQVCHYLRDELGNLLEIRDESGSVAAFRSDARGLLVEGYLPNGGATRIEYDAHGNRRRIIEPDGTERLLHHDYLGRIVAMRDERGLDWKYAYDPMGRLATIVAPSGARWLWEYDVDGFLSRIIDGDGRATTLEWGGFHVVTSVRRPNGDCVQYRYDREQNLVGIVNEQRETHRFERDSAGRILSEQTFDGRDRSFRHDHEGRIVMIRHADATFTEFRYDLLGRLAERSHSDGSKEEFDYDPLGRLVEARTSESVTSFCYDVRGNVIREQTEYAGESFRIDALYDASGRVVRCARSTGETLDVERDVLGRPTTVRFAGDTIAERAFAPHGFETSRQLPSGGRILMKMTAERLLERVEVTAKSVPRVRPGEPDWIGSSESSTLLRRYRWSASDYLAGVELGNHLDVEIERDEHARVTARRVNGRTVEAFTYSPAGDPYDVTSGAAGRRKYEQGGRLTESGSTSREYDARGRLTVERTRSQGAEGERRFVWGDNDLLKEVRDRDGRCISFTYDAFGRRLEKRVEQNGRIERRCRFHWQGDMLVHEIHELIDASGQVVSREMTYAHVPGEGAPLAHRARSGGLVEGWRHYVYTANGFVDALVDDAGRVTGSLDASLFGCVDSHKSHITPLRAPGQYFDEETGLVYNRFRYYDPENGLYITPEPLGVEGSLSPYAYASSRPLDMVDDTGLAERMWTRIRRTDGSHVYGYSEGRQRSDLHPAVQAALPRQNARGQRSNVDPQSCGEPHALSAHIEDFERRTGQSCRPGDPGWRDHLGQAMREIDRNSGIESRYGGGDRANPEQSFNNNAGNENAPCPNCSQTIPRLYRLAGMNPPSGVAAPGLRADGTGPFRSSPAAPGFHRNENQRASEIAGMDPQPWLPRLGTFEYVEGRQRWRRR